MVNTGVKCSKEYLIHSQSKSSKEEETPRHNALPNSISDGKVKRDVLTSLMRSEEDPLSCNSSSNSRDWA
jgi:hypothetical protein